MYNYLFLTFFFVFGITSSVSFAVRSYVHVVGSSTVFPLVSYSAEEFGRKNRLRIPTVEATGTGSGFKLFCSGIGDSVPDIATASRKISQAELELCKINGVPDPLEIKIGYDGIVIAGSVSRKKLDFSKMDLFLALSSYIAQDDFVMVRNTNMYWSDINDNFPNQKIEIYGPTRDSGTYDSLIKIVFLESCMQTQAFRMKYNNYDDLKKACSIVRDDGRFVETGNDESLIVQKMIHNPDIIGIFGYNFLQNNSAVIQGNMINGIDPTHENISSGAYTLSRPLYLYVKREHLNTIKHLKPFILETVNKVAIGKDGYLVSQGLIPISENELSALQEEVHKSLK